MAYATINDLRTILPTTVTVGNNTLATSEVLQSQGKADSISIAVANTYLNFANTYIDGRLRNLYFCPLKRIKTLETEIAKDIAINTDIVTVEDAGAFTQGKLVRISDGTNSQLVTVAETYDDDPARFGQFKVSPQLDHSYLVATPTLASIIAYPDPIPLVCAQMAASRLIDKLFVTEKAPDVPTGYGKTLRSNANEALDAILAGALRLIGQDFAGDRFVRKTLFDNQKSGSTYPPGQGKE